MECLTVKKIWVYWPEPLCTVEYKTFKCTCFVHILEVRKNKLSAKSMKCIFLRYSRYQKGYKCYNPSFKGMFHHMWHFLRTHPLNLEQVPNLPHLFMKNHVLYLPEISWFIICLLQKIESTTPLIVAAHRLYPEGTTLGKLPNLSLVFSEVPNTMTVPTFDEANK